MANLSSFPQTLDSFTFKTEIQASDVPAITRFQELKLKANRTPTEENELANLTTQLRSKLIAADEWNKFSDALVNMELFLTEEITDYVTAKQSEINATKDAALILIEQKKANIIDYMDGTTAGAIRNDMGDLTTLTTTDKTSLVKAINENKTLIGIQISYGVTSGTNTYTLSPTPSLTSYTDGAAVSVKIGTTNTGSSTINVNGLGAKSILDSKGNAMTSGKLRATSIYTLRYNGTDFILQGEGGYGNAASSDLLSGKTASTDVGDIIGTMPNNGVVNRTPSNVAQSIPAGYTSGGTVAAVVVPAANVLTGTTIASTAGTMPNRGTPTFTPTNTNITLPEGYYGTTTTIAAVTVDASKVLSGTTIANTAGTMPNQSAIAPNGHATSTNRTVGAYTSGNSNIRVYLTPPAGYYDGTTWVAQDEPNLTPNNVRLGTAILNGSGSGFVGTLEETKQVYISSPTYRSWQDPSNPYKVLKAARVDMAVTVRVSCQIICGLNNGVTTFMYITKNGTVVSTTYSTTASGEGLAISLDLAVNSGDLIECWVRPASFSGAGAIKNFLVTNVVTSPTKGAVIVD